MKTVPPFSLAPLATLLSQVPLMRSDAFSALQRDWLPLLTGDLGATEVMDARIARITADINDDGDEEDPDESMPWDVTPDDLIDMIGSVAVVSIQGKLCTGLSPFESWCYGMTRSEDISAALTMVGMMPSTAIVLNINSPGGFAMGMPELAAQIADLAAVRLTVAFTAGQMCSAAYWIGSQAGSLYSSLSAQVGCVGTYATFYDYSEMLKQRGVSVEVLAAGKFKGIGAFGTSLTAAQREFLQADVDRTNSRFLAAVKASREGVSDDDLQGQWFDGEQAAEKKLSDGVQLSLADLVSTFNRMIPASMIYGRL